MIHAAIVPLPDNEQGGEISYLVIDTHLADPGEVWNVKKLPGRVYSDTMKAWVIPIRPGLAETYKKIFKSDMVASLIEPHEARFLEALKPPAPGSVNIWKVSAGEAVDRATTYHLHDTHNGNEADYNRVHSPYIYGE